MRFQPRTSLWYVNKTGSALRAADQATTSANPGSGRLTCTRSGWKSERTSFERSSHSIPKGVVESMISGGTDIVGTLPVRICVARDDGRSECKLEHWTSYL